MMANVDKNTSMPKAQRAPILPSISELFWLMAKVAPAERVPPVRMLLRIAPFAVSEISHDGASHSHLGVLCVILG